MKKRRIIAVLVRGLGLIVAAGLVWYGYAIQHADDVIVGMAGEHAAKHDVGDPSKAEAGGNLLSMFSDLFGLVFMTVGAVVALLVVFPWGKVVRDRES